MRGPPSQKAEQADKKAGQHSYDYLSIQFLQMCIGISGASCTARKSGTGRQKNGTVSYKLEHKVQ